MRETREWSQIPKMERIRLIEDVVEGKTTLSSLYGIPGLSPITFSKFISCENEARRQKKDNNLLPGLVELKRISRERAGEDHTRRSNEHDRQEESGKREDGVSFEDNGNIGVATLTTCFPQNAQFDNLLNALNIDKNDWVVERVQPNTWQTMTSKRGEPEIVTLYQMKAWLRRKVPVYCEWPTIAPVMINPNFMRNVAKHGRRSNGTSRAHRMRCALVIPDSQNGYSRDARTGTLHEFHDRRAWELSCMMAEKLKPDMIVLIGDHCDLPEWSEKFVRTPDMYFTTQPMLLELAWWLGRLRTICPDAEIVYIEGNHEERLQRAVTSNIVVARGLTSVDDFKRDSVPALSIPKLLSLESIGVRYEGSYPSGVVWINDNIKAEHGNIAKSHPQETARAILNRSRSSTIFGHVHRREVASKNEYRKGGFVTYIAECFGCICHLDGRVPAHDTKHDWNQGLGVVWYEPGNGLFRTEHVPIHEGKAIYGGEVMTGLPDIKAMERDCNWRFGYL